MDVVLAGHRVRNEEVRFHVVTFALLEDLVRAILVFILDIKDRIDEVFVLQEAEAILPLDTREYGAVLEGCLPIQVELRGPPGGSAVLELHPEGVKVITAALGSKRGEILDLQVAGLLKVMVVGDDVRVLVSKRARRPEYCEQGKQQ
jgi:hypothetical protein